MSETFSKQLRDVTNTGRHLGHQEFRIAAMRFFEKLKMPAQAVGMALLDVDKYLTEDELAERSKLP